ncbi:hypothetical protein JW949_02060 [Candidatus Woesearchaeota archaeon]|nr:hypothetical protein [Candidatus Woesearchaeota archaeon]
MGPGEFFKKINTSLEDFNVFYSAFLFKQIPAYVKVCEDVKSFSQMEVELALGMNIIDNPETKSRLEDFIYGLEKKYGFKSSYDLNSNGSNEIKLIDNEHNPFPDFKPSSKNPHLIWDFKNHRNMIEIKNDHLLAYLVFYEPREASEYKYDENYICHEEFKNYFEIKSNHKKNS